jgi:ornithine cyclodeaminase/alanine dehydrogenase-like protein (mu-crystallin family)
VLFLDRQDIIALLPLAECMTAVERAFAEHALGLLPAAPGVLGNHVPAGGFHVKTAAIGGTTPFYAAKINANFPGNPEGHGLPAIQGIIGLFDAENGRPLALLDSIEITTLRTAAASAIAARLLALPDAATLLVCGCGNQGRAHLRAMLGVRPLRRVLAYDPSAARLDAFVRDMTREAAIEIPPVGDLSAAFPGCDIAVTCTPARTIVVSAGDVRPGQFIAAVGADSEGKQELDPRILADSRVVADLANKAATMGELQHAIAANLMRIEDLHAELGQIIAGERPGRTTAKQIFVFDSTGTALQDVAAAAMVYRRARAAGRGRELLLDGA